MGEKHAGSETLSQVAFLEDFRAFRKSIAGTSIDGPGTACRTGKSSPGVGTNGRCPEGKSLSVFAREASSGKNAAHSHQTKGAVGDIRTNARLMVDSRHPGLEDAAKTGCTQKFAR
jgi:hypothetical protein